MGLYEIAIELTQQPDIQKLIFNFFLPFILTFAILWGVLSMMKLFKRNINVIIAFVVTVFIANTEFFTLIVPFFSQVTGVLVILVFFAVFFYGTLKWGTGKSKEIRGKFAPQERLDYLNKEIAKQREKLDSAATEEEEREIRKTIKELREEREEVLDKMKGQ